ncbi:hypothetical protein [Salinibacillus aidingensis]
MEWHGLGHGMALAYIRLDLGAAAGQIMGDGDPPLMEVSLYQNKTH